MLNFSEDDLSESFIAGDVCVTEFPQFPESLETLFAQNTQLSSSQPLFLQASQSSAKLFPSEEEQNFLKAQMSIAAYAVDNGDGLAALCIGQNYETGEIGGSSSLEKALFWYNRSAQLGSRAFIALGKIHEII